MWLSHACGHGSKTAVSLIRYFGDAYQVFLAEEELDEVGFVIDKRIKSNLLYKDVSEEEYITGWCDDNGVKILCPDSSLYPPSLRSLADAPMVLYVQGELPDFTNTFSCAVVGTRSMSDYGRDMAYKLGYGLATGGACLVSGLAKGCDAMAIRGALDAGGITICVLGCGIDIVYPKENEALWERILQNGAIVTEYSPGVSPKGRNFPVRNRIISGLSQAACVVEGDMKSGSLITARHTIYQGRDLFAVPVRVGDKGAEGTNHLIKNGAEAVTRAEDILARYEYIYPHSVNISSVKVPEVREEADEEIRILPKKKKKAPAKDKKIKEKPFPPTEKKAISVSIDMLSETEQTVYRFMIPDVPMLAEEICSASKLPVNIVLSSLTLLEIAGVVEGGAGGYFMRHADDEEVGEPAITELDEGF